MKEVLVIMSSVQDEAKVAKVLTMLCDANIDVDAYNVPIKDAINIGRELENCREKTLSGIIHKNIKKAKKQETKPSKKAAKTADGKKAKKPTDSKKAIDKVSKKVSKQDTEKPKTKTEKVKKSGKKTEKGKKKSDKSKKGNKQPKSKTESPPEIDYDDLEDFLPEELSIEKWEDIYHQLSRSIT